MNWNVYEVRSTLSPWVKYDSRAEPEVVEGRASTCRAAKRKVIELSGANCDKTIDFDIQTTPIEAAKTFFVPSAECPSKVAFAEPCATPKRARANGCNCSPRREYCGPKVNV